MENGEAGCVVVEVTDLDGLWAKKIRVGEEGIVETHKQDKLHVNNDCI